MEHVLDQETAELLRAGTKVSDEMIVVFTIFYSITWSLSLFSQCNYPFLCLCPRFSNPPYQEHVLVTVGKLNRGGYWLQAC